jgi:hypothetical protein
MAVRIDIDALLDSVDAETRDTALDLAESIRSLRPSSGGARAAVGTHPAKPVDCWIGIRAGILTADCECRRARADELCAHAVAVARAAVAEGYSWSVQATAPHQQRPREHAEWFEVTQKLSHRELAEITAAYAADDRALANTVLAAAGLLGAPGADDIAAVRKTLDDALAIETGGWKWDLHDIATAGYRLAEELTLLAQRPGTAEALTVAQDAIEAWDGHLYAVLSQDDYFYQTEPSDIAALIAAAHLEISRTLRPDPVELGKTLARLEACAEIESSLDLPGDYEELLGVDGVDAYRNAGGR